MARDSQSGLVSYVRLVAEKLRADEAEARVLELERVAAEKVVERARESDRLNQRIRELEAEVARLESQVEADNERWRRLTFRRGEDDK